MDLLRSTAKERVYTSRIEGNDHLHKAGQVLKLFTDGTIAPQTPFQDVQTHAFGILERPKLEFIADHLATHARFDETAFQWDHLDQLAPQFKRHVRPLLLAIDFAATSAHAPLITAVHFLRTAFQKGRSLGHYPSDMFPTRFIPETLKRYLYTPDTRGKRRLLPDRYEFLVYRLLRNGLEAGDLFCRDSVRFRSFEDDLLDDRQWQAKDALMADAGLALLMQPIQEHLAALEQQLEGRMAEVNQRIAAGENEHMQITRRGPRPLPVGTPGPLSPRSPSESTAYRLYGWGHGGTRNSSTSRRVQTWWASPAAIAGVRGCQRLAEPLPCVGTGCGRGRRRLVWGKHQLWYV